MPNNYVDICHWTSKVWFPNFEIPFADKPTDEEFSQLGDLINQDFESFEGALEAICAFYSNTDFDQFSLPLGVQVVPLEVWRDYHKVY